MATWNRSAGAVRRWLALALTIGGAGVLVVLLARTAAGAVRAQLAPWQVALLTAAGCAVAMASWRLDDEDRTDDEPRVRLARMAASLLCGLLFGLLLARTSGSSAAAVVVVTLTWSIAGIGRILQLGESFGAVTTAAVTELRARRDHRAQQTLPSHAAAYPPTRPEMLRGDQPATAVAGEAVVESHPLDDALLIRLQRRMTPDGDAIEIQARLEFPVGAREAVLHVPFWPALAADPEVECEPLEGDEVDLRVTSAERYGVRLEGRLASPVVSSRSVPIGIEIRAAVTHADIPVAA